MPSSAGIDSFDYDHWPGGWTADFVDPDEHYLSFYQSERAPRRNKT